MITQLLPRRLRRELSRTGAVLHYALDASKERKETRKKPFWAFSAQSRSPQSSSRLRWEARLHSPTVPQSHSPAADCAGSSGLRWEQRTALGVLDSTGDWNRVACRAFRTLRDSVPSAID